MTQTSKRKKVNRYNVARELKQVDALFAGIAKDKSLPTFVEHVFLCVVLGTAEHVNLKTMYPKLCGKISKWVISHNRKIISLHKTH
jgi:hypothetical protein